MKHGFVLPWGDAAAAAEYLEADWSVAREKVLEYARKRLAAGVPGQHVG